MKSEDISLFKTIKNKVYNYKLKKISGNLPENINGILMTTGMSRAEIGDKEFSHPFDSPGLLSCFKINNGEIFLSTHDIFNQRMIEEIENQEIIYGRVMGTEPNNYRIKSLFHILSSNNLNVKVIKDDLWFLGEPGSPFKLPKKVFLNHFEEKLFGKLITKYSEKKSLISCKLNEILSAHPIIDRKRKEIILIRNHFFGSLPYNKVCLEEYDFNYRLKRKIDVPNGVYAPIIHQIGITKNYYVLLLPKVKMKIRTIFPGKLNIPDVLDPEIKTSCHLLVLDRNTGKIKFKMPFKPKFMFHCINCFEENKCAIHMIGTFYNNLNLLRKLLREALANLGSEILSIRIDMEKPSIKSKTILTNCEMPCGESMDTPDYTNSSWFIGSTIRPYFYDAINDICQVIDLGEVVYDTPHFLCRLGKDSYFLLQNIGKKTDKSKLTILRNHHVCAEFEMPFTIPITFHGDYINFS